MSAHSVAEEAVDIAAAKPVRRPWIWATGVVVVVLCAQIVQLLVTNPNFEWPVVAAHLFDPSILRGVYNTCMLTVQGMLLGIVLGGILALLKMSDSRLLRSIASGYIWVFRGTPELVQLIFWFNIGLVLPQIGLGIPFGPLLISAEANDVITPIVAAVIGLGFHEAAYQAEIYRAGFLSVPNGPLEAARSLGMNPVAVFFRVRLPLAARFIVPPMFNQVIGMTKGTSLVSVIGGSELLFSVQEIYNETFQTIPLLIVACIWYLVITSVLNVCQHFIERHYGRSSRPIAATRTAVPNAPAATRGDDDE